MTVVYAGTRNLYETMHTACRSLLENNRVDRVYLLIEDSVFPFQLPENVIPVNASRQNFFTEDGANYKSRWTYMAMIRVALAKMFPREDKMLWLDCDTIVDDDISELFTLDMDGYFFAGVKEVEKSRKRDYINTGVLLMNLEEIRKYRLDDALISYMNKKALELPDQDAINSLAYGKIKFIDSCYNVCPFTAQTEKIKIYHYAGRKIFDNDPIYKKYSRKDTPTRTLIAIPCLDMVHTDFMECMLKLDKMDNTSFTVMKNSLVYDARNLIANNAIRYGFDRVLWLDSDMVFKPDILKRLSDDMGGRDFVTGLYFMRHTVSKPVVYKKLWYEVTDNQASAGAEHIEEYPEGIFEIAGSGFGCVMTSTRLLKALDEKYGAPFTPMMGLGEDLAFCWRATQNGFKMYCDARIKCGHIGQKVFDGM